MKNSFYIDLQRFMLIPTKFPLTQEGNRRFLVGIGLNLYLPIEKGSHPTIFLIRQVIKLTA